MPEKRLQRTREAYKLDSWGCPSCRKPLVRTSDGYRPDCYCDVRRQIEDALQMAAALERDC